jgi:FMN-dependent NADH-azoreductase
LKGFSALISRLLTRETVANLKALHPDAEVVYRDLAAEPLRHYTAVIRRFGADHNGTPDQNHELETGKKILEEFQAAGTIVLGAPMYNWGIPSQLKAWIDLLIVPGVTFRSSPTEFKGLLGVRRIIIVSSRGGSYGPGSPVEAADFQEKYLQTVFGFLCITNIEVIRAERVARGPEKAAVAVGDAKQQVATLA